MKALSNVTVVVIIWLDLIIILTWWKWRQTLVSCWFNFDQLSFPRWHKIWCDAEIKKVKGALKMRLTRLIYSLRHLGLYKWFFCSILLSTISKQHSWFLAQCWIFPLLENRECRDRESNPGLLGEKRERYLCATPPLHPTLKKPTNLGIVS